MATSTETSFALNLDVPPAPGLASCGSAAGVGGWREPDHARDGRRDGRDAARAVHGPAEHDSGAGLPSRGEPEACTRTTQTSGKGSEKPFQRGLRLERLDHPHVEAELGAVESAGTDQCVLRSLLNLELEEHVSKNGPRRCPRQGENGWTGLRGVGAGLADHATQAEVTGAELVTPFGNAVGLVDYGEVDRRNGGHLGQGRPEVGGLEPFGSDEHEERVPRSHLVEDRPAVTVLESVARDRGDPIDTVTPE